MLPLGLAETEADGFEETELETEELAEEEGPAEEDVVLVGEEEGEEPELELDVGGEGVPVGGRGREATLLNSK